MNGERNKDAYGERPDINRETVGSPKRKVSDLAEGLKKQASDISEDVTRQVREQASHLAESAKDAASGAGDKLRSAVEDQKRLGADYVSGLAGAVRRAAGEFDGQMPQAGDYIRRAAEQIDGASQALRERDLGQLLQGVTDFARRQPTAFLAATVLAGFAAVRFLKSSNSSGQRGDRAGPYRSENERHLAGSASRLPHEQM
jgi:hypothetical protein